MSGNARGNKWKYMVTRSIKASKAFTSVETQLHQSQITKIVLTF